MTIQETVLKTAKVEVEKVELVNQDGRHIVEYWLDCKLLSRQTLDRPAGDL